MRRRCAPSTRGGRRGRRLVVVGEVADGGLTRAARQVAERRAALEGDRPRSAGHRLPLRRLTTGGLRLGLTAPPGVPECPDGGGDLPDESDRKTAGNDQG